MIRDKKGLAKHSTLARAPQRPARSFSPAAPGRGVPSHHHIMGQGGFDEAQGWRGLTAVGGTSAAEQATAAVTDVMEAVSAASGLAGI